MSSKSSICWSKKEAAASSSNLVWVHFELVTAVTSAEVVGGAGVAAVGAAAATALLVVFATPSSNLVETAEVMGGMRATVAEAMAPEVVLGQPAAAFVVEGGRVEAAGGVGPSMAAMATEAAATEDKSEAAECWCVGGGCCLGGVWWWSVPPSPAAASFSLLEVEDATAEAALDGFFFRLLFLTRFDPPW